MALQQLRRQILIAGADLGQCLQRHGVLVHRLIGAAEVEVSRVDMAAAFDQLLEIDGRFTPGLRFHTDQRHGETQVVIGRVLLDQRRELAHGFFQAILFDQQARVGQAQALVFGVLAQALLQQRQGFIAALQAMQQARFQEDGGDLTLLGRLLLQQCEGFLAAIVLL